MSTATVAVAVDDADEVLDALKEAELTAKAAIAKFMNETIQSDEGVSKAVETDIRIVGEHKTVTKATLKKTFSSIRNSSQALVKGILKIGDCYTQGEIVRVTVGLKPESISQAEKIGLSVSEPSESGQQSAESGQTSNEEPNLKPTDGFNNSKGILDF